MKVSDATLINGIRLGEYSLFNELFMRYYSRLCAFVYDITNDKSSAEDIVQELFIRIWERRSNIDIQESVSGFLFRAARNAALNHIRGEKSRRLVQLDIPQEEVSIEPDRIEKEEFRVMLEQCMNALPERCQLVFKMHRIEGLKQKEISEKLNISIKTIKNQIWKAMKYLRSCLEVQEDA
ncbi:RNA polymerase sigma-70 factor [Puteibacter caeruleilacunae]|nr:RNA polymerase sigma-70 factor [Puteibacter caeruleilacunae]